MEPQLLLSSGELSTKHHVATAIFSIVITPTLFANLLLLFIVFRSTHFRDLSTMLVAFISIADVMYTIYMCGYIAIQYTLDDVSDITATVIITTQSVLRMVPVVIFLLIAYNWYIAKFKPTLCYKFHQINNISVKCFLASWFVSFAICAGVPFVVSGRFKMIPFLAYSVLSFAFQLIALVTEICLHTTNLLKTIEELKNNSKSKKKKNNILWFNLKITKVFLFLSVAYFVFAVPLLVYPIFEHYLHLKSSKFLIFCYHLLTCIPCLMNPISLYFISQKFQDELRGLFGMSKSTKNKNEKKQNPITPEAYSANRGFFEPRTPTWRQGDEYWDREVIYGEYPSVINQSITPTRTKDKKKKDVRFSEIVEEVEPNSPDINVSTTSHDSPPAQATCLPGSPESPSISASAPSFTESPRISRKTVPAPGSPKPIKSSNTSKSTPIDIKGSEGLGSRIEHPRSSSFRTIAALDLGTKQRSLSGSWPRSHTSPYNRFDEIDLSRLGPASLLQQNKQFKRNILKRSRSCYHHNRIGQGNSTSQNSENQDAWRAVSTTRTVQVHIDVREEEHVLETYL